MKTSLLEKAIDITLLVQQFLQLREVFHQRNPVLRVVVKVVVKIPERHHGFPFLGQLHPLTGDASEGGFLAHVSQAEHHQDSETDNASRRAAQEQKAIPLRERQRREENGGACKTQRQRSLGANLFRRLGAAPGIDRSGQNRKERQQADDSPKAPAWRSALFQHLPPRSRGEDGHGGKAGEKVGGKLGSGEGEKCQREEDPAEEVTRSTALIRQAAQAARRSRSDGKWEKRAPVEQSDDQDGKVIVDGPGVTVNRRGIALDVPVDDEIVPEKLSVTQGHGQIPGCSHEKEREQARHPGDPRQLPDPSREDQVASAHQAGEHDTYRTLREGGTPRSGERYGIPEARRAPAL